MEPCWHTLDGVLIDTKPVPDPVSVPVILFPPTVILSEAKDPGHESLINVCHPYNVGVGFKVAPSTNAEA